MKDRQTRRRSRGRIALLMACAAPGALLWPATANAQIADAGTVRTFSIPAGPLSQALQAYSAATGVQLV